ncbi:hypothetical protein SCLCIDRAFT_8932 [Scleroderma citrinum Foug A]|uniref:Uncharacterized protein n=1 Tax=Scleroderma citrinum Foug A TaxID=1036808 RepID=A0A0C3AE35_9AGAM|nr:hypothetical protein SCLCIDRAFT_8932 [Scleroderma citrinum Foug A]
MDFNQLLVHIEFEDSEYFNAFQVPTPDDGITKIGLGEKLVDDTFLICRWAQNQDAWEFSVSGQQKMESRKFTIAMDVVKDICDVGKSLQSLGVTRCSAQDKEDYRVHDHWCCQVYGRPSGGFSGSIAHRRGWHLSSILRQGVPGKDVYTGHNHNSGLSTFH